MDTIEKEFNDKAIIRGGIYLFNSVDDVAVIRRCNELKNRILGIDSFKVTENSTQPILEHSVDFSNNVSDSGNWVEAEQFIQERFNEGFLFEIVCK
jgi:hypothetical protein